MIKLQSKTNVGAPDSEYPYGQILDQSLTQDGTPVDVNTYQDMHQFFEKLIRESTLTPNDLPDNEYNGWQLWAAFEEHVKNIRLYTRWYARLTQSGTGNPTYVEDTTDIGSPTSAIRTSTGRYDFFFADSPFLSGNLEVFLGGNEFGSGGIALPVWGLVGSNNQLRLYTIDPTTGSATDGLLNNTAINVKVYE